MAKRFGEHYRQKREGRGSYSLFRWADHEQAEVQAVVLTWAEGTQSNATYFEGYWLQRALNADFEAPALRDNQLTVKKAFDMARFRLTSSRLLYKETIGQKPARIRGFCNSLRSPRRIAAPLTIWVIRQHTN